MPPRPRGSGFDPADRTRRTRRVARRRRASRRRCWSTCASHGNSTHCRIDGSLSRAAFPAARRACPSCRPSANWSSSATTAAAASTRRSGSRGTASPACTTCAAASTRGRRTSNPACTATDRTFRSSRGGALPPRTDGLRNMRKPRPPFLAIAVCAAVLCTGGAASGEDLLQIYREAQKNDPTIAAARSPVGGDAGARAAGALRAAAAACRRRARRTSTTTTPRQQRAPKNSFSANYSQGNLTFSASQPLYRPQYVVALDQAREQVTQSDFTLAISQQDLIIRTSVAYFDVLLAEFNVELAEQQKKAVAEQLAQAKRNFEVGTATITDTNEAQAKYDSIVATEIQARNDLDRRRTALHGHHRPASEEPEAHRPRLRRRAAESEQSRLLGRPRAEGQPVGALLAVELRDRVARSRPRARGPLSDARPRGERRRAGAAPARRRRTSRATRARRCWASC